MVIVPTGWQEFDGLTCGFGGRDDVATPARLVTVEQVHGNTIVAAEHVASSSGPVEADAVSVRSRGVTAAIRTADCVAILLVSPETRWAAAVHAGWRGTVADIAGVAVGAAAGAGVERGSLWASIGPSIGPCCYEVGEEVAARFDALGLAVGRGGPKPVLDLREINRTRLVSAGVSNDRIQMCGPCTRCHSDRYWSFRADGERAGRQLSWIGWERRTPSTDR